MKNYYRKQLLVALILPVAFGSQKLFALQADSLSFAAPIITEAVGSSPMTIQVSFIDTNRDEYGYYFDYGTDPEGPFYREDIYFGSRLDSGQVIVYNTNSGYEPNTTVYIKVAAFVFDDLTGTYSAPGPFSELVAATTLAGWPPSPTEFAATAEDGGIRLTWVDNSAPGHPLDEAYWLILRSNDGGNYNRSDTVPANTNFFVDTEVAPNTTYHYRLEAMNHFGHGYDVYGAVATALPVVDTPTVPASNVFFLTPTPTSLSILFTPGDGMKRLAVMKAGSTPVSFQPVNNIMYSGDVGDQQTVVYNGSGSSFVVNGLQRDTEYFLKIFEYNTDGSAISYLRENAAMLSMRTAHPSDGLQNFSVVDVRTETKLFDFYDSGSLDAGHPDFKNMTIRANVNPDAVGSILFRVNDRQINIENEDPFLLRGYSLHSLSHGEHSLEAAIYSKRSGKGVLQQSAAAKIHVMNNSTVTGFGIVDQNGILIRTLRDGDILSFEKSQFSNMNINAILNRTTSGGSVDFLLDGAPFRIGNQAPYVMVSGKPKWWGTPGHYSVRATPYSRKNGKGVPGTPMIVSFTIAAPQLQKTTTASARLVATIEDQSEGKKSISIYPVPTDRILNVLITDYKDPGSAYVVIRDIYSHVVFKGAMSITSGRLTFDLDELGLTNGVYFLQVRTPTMNANMKFVKDRGN